jgi:transcription initiation factor TFIIIB Brf1 subunit/transcription initiation factor TFIIB
MSEVKTKIKTTTTEHNVDYSAEPMKMKLEEAGSRATPSTHFRHYLEPAIYRLETPRLLHNQIVSLATHLGVLIDELGICPETTPSSLAASALALTCETMGLEKTNAEVAKVCTISVATLQKCLKRIEPWRTILFKGSEGGAKK